MAKANATTTLFSSCPAQFFPNRTLDASYVGNGTVGASVLGAYSNEEITINHTAHKWKGYTGVLQDVSDVFPKVRKLYNEAKIFDAERALSAELDKRGYRPSLAMPLPLATICVNLAHEGFITDYARMTDMSAAEAIVNYRAGGTEFTRSVFVGRGNDIIGYNVARSGPDKVNVQINFKGLPAELAKSATIKYEGGLMYLSVRMQNGLDSGIVARVVTATGQAECSANGITVRGSDNLTLFAKCFVNSSADNEFKSIKNELVNIKLNYDKMAQSNEAAHKKLFSEATLELGHEMKADNISDLINGVGKAALGTNLTERMWNFGKYLSIIGGGNLTPAGLWCGDYGSTNGYFEIYNTANLLYDGVTKSVQPGSLLELLEYFEKYVDDLKKNAARVYGMDGYFIPNVISPSSALFGSTHPSVVNFVAGSAILANLFYSYYLVTGDKKVLKSRILPFMTEVAKFYSDFLKLDSNGVYTTMPSYSPMSTPGNVIQGKPLTDFSFATNSTIDFLALGALLDNLIEAAGAADASKSEIPMWLDMKTKMPQFTVNDQGNLKEYTNSAFIDGVYNSGVTMGYGLYPFKSFSFSDKNVQFRAAVSGALPSTISLKKASSNAIITRLTRASALQDAGTVAMGAIQLAHSGEGQNVKNALLRLVASCFMPSGQCMANDWRGSGWTKSKSPELDIRGNIGFATAITECIVQSNSNTLKILPAVFDELSVGRVRNIATDFAGRVSVDWDLRRNKCQIAITAKNECKIDVILNPAFRKPKTKDIVVNDSVIRGIQLPAGKTVVIEF
jgi:alpha-L-fucosidase 2